MSIKTKRMVFTMLEIAGIIWNFLCMQGTIQLKYYSSSVIWVFGFELILIFLGNKGEKSSYITELSTAEKTLAGIDLVLGFAWIVTIIACMFY